MDSLWTQSIIILSNKLPPSAANLVLIRSCFFGIGMASDIGHTHPSKVCKGPFCLFLLGKLHISDLILVLLISPTFFLYALLPKDFLGRLFLLYYVLVLLHLQVS